MPEGPSLERFLLAQAPVYAQVKDELRRGHKASHWMWFIFPQFTGLGHSSMARHFALHSLAEAQAYLQHPVLGSRLRECFQLVLDTRNLTVHDIFGYPDELKFRSCATLFAAAAPDEPVFSTALQRFFPGPDAATLSLLATSGSS